MSSGEYAWIGGQRELPGETHLSQVLVDNEKEAKKKWRHSTLREQHRQNKGAIVESKQAHRLKTLKKNSSFLLHCRKGGGQQGSN